MTFQKGNHGLRTPTHHFIRYRDGATELYDLTVDPLQIEDLSNDSNHRVILTQLDSKLDELLAQ